jgi:hypothetical protein
LGQGDRTPTSWQHLLLLLMLLLLLLLLVLVLVAPFCPLSFPRQYRRVLLGVLCTLTQGLTGQTLGGTQVTGCWGGPGSSTLAALQQPLPPPPAAAAAGDGGDGAWGLRPVGSSSSCCCC